jgi:YfiR/HmsC-like
MPESRRARLYARAGPAAALALLAVSARAETVPEKEVEATYLYKLAPFVDWPPGAFASPNAPVTICVVGDDPFGPMLDQAVEGKTRGARPIVARRLERASADAGCQIMYVAGSRQQSVGEALHAVEGAPVLTVTDSGPADRRGMVNFVRQDNRIRFEIDEAAASQSGVTISAKLLELAVSVRRRP